ncbi:hypothetical protein VTK26DRAFT_8395 [Humicola hyalothermophila]
MRRVFGPLCSLVAGPPEHCSPVCSRSLGWRSVRLLLRILNSQLDPPASTLNRRRMSPNLQTYHTTRCLSLQGLCWFRCTALRIILGCAPQFRPGPGSAPNLVRCISKRVQHCGFPSPTILSQDSFSGSVPKAAAGTAGR